MAYLSIRVPEHERAAVKAIAHCKGVSVQNLMNEWVDELIAQQDAVPPSLGELPLFSGIGKGGQ